MANVKMNTKPTAEDFAYAYVEDEHGALVRVPKDKIVALGKDGGYYAPYVDTEGNLTWIPSETSMAPIVGTNIKGVKGDKGDKGDTGAAGAPGSDATVTSANIKSALGFTPASEQTVSELSQEIVGLKENAVTVTYDASTKTLNISSASGGGDN